MTDDDTRPTEPPAPATTDDPPGTSDATSDTAPTPVPDAPASADGPPVAGSDALAPPSPAPPTAAGAIPGWRSGGQAPSGTARTIGCILGGLILLFLGLVLTSIIGLIFLGGQVSNILAGSIAFGTSGSACAVDDPSTTVSGSGPIYVVGYFQRPAAAGKTIVLNVSSSEGSGEVTRETVTSATDCMYLEVPPGSAPNTYTFEFTTNGEVLATGALQITP